MYDDGGRFVRALTQQDPRGDAPEILPVPVGANCLLRDVDVRGVVTVALVVIRSATQTAQLGSGDA